MVLATGKFRTVFYYVPNLSMYNKYIVLYGHLNDTNVNLFRVQHRCTNSYGNKILNYTVPSSS